jgi:proton-dependent oligopeptide transporter, POT family
VLVDPETTVQRIMLIFYASINIGSFFEIATTYSEKYVGYWLAFLLPGIIYFLLPFLIWFLYKRLVKKPPVGSEFTRFVKITLRAIKENNGNLFVPSDAFWGKAKMGTLREKGVNVSWSDKNVKDVQRTWQACQIFLYIPLYQMNDGGRSPFQCSDPYGTPLTWRAFVKVLAASAPTRARH